MELKSNSCSKLKLSGENSEEDECTISPMEQTGLTYKFTYNYKLFSEESMIINYKVSITSEKSEILYRQEAISVSGIYSGGNCEYKFILPDNYVNLGLKNYEFKKESDKIYSYIDSCPSTQINDVVRMAPKESYWIADYGIFLEFNEPLSKNATFKIPRVYRGGKNRNKNYEITTYEGEVLKESVLTKNEVFLEALVPGKNNDIVGIIIRTAFSNKLNDEFNVYTSESFYNIDADAIDNTIKAKAEEIINDPNSPYQGKPNYYKIGKFVHSHITYNLNYHGRNLTALEIYNGKMGVCEHYTILYNAMLNAIGIKTISTFGWAFDQDKTTANEKTIGHAWTVALIDGRFIELDATWDLFEGVPAGHILKGYKKETLSYSTNVPKQDIKNFYKLENIELVNNLDDEEGNSEETITTPSPSPSSEESATALVHCLMGVLLLLLYVHF